MWLLQPAQLAQSQAKDSIIDGQDRGCKCGQSMTVQCLHVYRLFCVNILHSLPTLSWEVAPSYPPWSQMSQPPWSLFSGPQPGKGSSLFQLLVLLEWALVIWSTPCLFLMGNAPLLFHGGSGEVVIQGLYFFAPGWRVENLPPPTPLPPLGREIGSG